MTEQMRPSKADRWLTPRQVAARFAVDPKTVTRWARAGYLTYIMTPGGHRRYRESLIDSLTQEQSIDGAPPVKEQ